ncbi:MAG: hypothetical protein QXU69_07960, partial [Thermofilaceae archaeon]
PSVLAAEVKSALFNAKRRPVVRSFIAGLGGRDVSPKDFERIVECSLKEGPEEVTWIGLRGVTPW